MSQLHVMVGLPASGKSTFVKTVKAVVVSSDALREELLGDVNDQSNNELIFNTLYERVEKSLKTGFMVFLDATNITAKTRKGIIERFRKHASKLVAHYFNTPITECYMRNYHRDRKVPEFVIERMFTTLQIPTHNEGWDEVIFHNYGCTDGSPNIYEKTLLNAENYTQLFDTFVGWNEINKMMEFPQDNPHHSLSVSRHTYHVWDYINKNYAGDGKLAMLWAALFHDTGKPVTKKFKIFEDGSQARYANFIGHENVSAQYAANVLAGYYDTKFVLEVVEIVQNHMRLLSAGESEKARNKLLKEVGQDVFDKLELFRIADTLAK